MAADPSASSSSSYLLMVQHLIEKCLLFHLNKDECVDALSHHAHVNPVITSTMWSELEKENKEFFEAYGKNRETSVREMRRKQAIRTMLTPAMPPCDVKELDHN